MNERILVVDDEETNRELLEAILVPDGYQVEMAADGEAALAQVARFPPDLVLLDLLMPGMHGLEVCQRLRQELAPELPIIVVTAVGQLPAKEAALTSGADDFVTKPVRPEDIRARVAALLKVRRIRRELDRTLAYLLELEASARLQRRAALAKIVGRTLPRPAPAGASVAVLLVDDEALTREFYGDLLAEHGFQVFATESGREALDLLERQPVEAVILDVQMPGISGLQVLARIRETRPELPVIMLTGHPTSQNAIASLKLGAFDFIIKGLEHGLVIMAVHRAVRHRREILERAEEFQRMQARIAELEAAPHGQRND
ncbi:MAG TPA: response regulator [Candidatus Sulfotelmatobacter sp.]|nr:response regulator [Candidatus Sulfotelmatobacter sp.]